MKSDKVYIYDNKEFHSLKQLASYVDINEKTITARLRRGMSVDEACKKLDLRCSYYLDSGVPKSITQICNEQLKNKELVENRLKYGYSLNDALNKPKKITRQGKPIVVNGILYNSIAAALRALNMLNKETTIRRKIKEGKEPDVAFGLNKE